MQRDPRESLFVAAEETLTFLSGRWVEVNIKNKNKKQTHVSDSSDSDVTGEPRPSHYLEGGDERRHIRALSEGARLS